MLKFHNRYLELKQESRNVNTAKVDIPIPIVEARCCDDATQPFSHTTTDLCEINLSSFFRSIFVMIYAPFHVALQFKFRKTKLPDPIQFSFCFVASCIVFRNE